MSERNMSGKGWIGVDLDGTLAFYQGWNEGKIGDPVPVMLARVKGWLAEGVEVRIVTARGRDPPADMGRLFAFGLHGQRSGAARFDRSLVRTASRSEAAGDGSKGLCHDRIIRRPVRPGGSQHRATNGW